CVRGWQIRIRRFDYW
nr:immunoglobulin heavy chain junction region [Macaca mulatta]MOW19030.1 immunoglobulin heavy chain junction region [Macaca mulatta]MOW19042.1 immunoglobulin heavy chain junction region [Macaca mulatta]MOW19046.1 immunoglobulin heavy chain junction region [Macaca mulatta]MOW19090.1 immunoglobulin heavy chain junction region [Macaca mulatta]